VPTAMSAVKNLGGGGATLARESYPSPVRAGGSGRGRVNSGEARRGRCAAPVRRQASSAAVRVGRTRSKVLERQPAGAASVRLGGRFSPNSDRVRPCRSGRARSRRHYPADSQERVGMRGVGPRPTPGGGLANRTRSTRSAARRRPPAGSDGGPLAGRSSSRNLGVSWCASVTRLRLPQRVAAVRGGHNLPILGAGLGKVNLAPACDGLRLHRRRQSGPQGREMMDHEHLQQQVRQAAPGLRRPVSAGWNRRSA